MFGGGNGGDDDEDDDGGEKKCQGGGGRKNIHNRSMLGIGLLLFIVIVLFHREYNKLDNNIQTLHQKQQVFLDEQEKEIEEKEIDGTNYSSENYLIIDGQSY